MTTPAPPDDWFAPPGLFGFFTRRPPALAKADLERIAGALRVPQGARLGTASVESAGAYVGWIARPGSFAPTLPFENEKRDCLLFFTGDHFFNKEDVVALKSRGHSIRKPDTSHLVHLYEEQGPGFVANLNGPFAGLLLDLRQNQRWLFTDRFGGRTIHYHEDGDSWYFATQALVLARTARRSRSIDSHALRTWLLEGRTPAAGPLVSGIERMPPAALWQLEPDGAVQRRCYFTVSTWEQQPYLASDFFITRYRDIVARVLPRYLRTDSRVGVALSTSPASQAMVSLVELPQGRFPCFTFGAERATSPDGARLADLARACRQDHRYVGIGPDFHPDFLRWLSASVFCADGFADASDAVRLHLATLASTIADAALTGLFWRSPITGPHAPLDNMALHEFLNPEVLRNGAAGPRPASNSDGGHPSSIALFTDLPCCYAPALAVVQAQLGLRNPFLDLELVELSYRLPVTGTERRCVAERLLTGLWPRPAGTDESSEKRRGRDVPCPPTSSWRIGRRLAVDPPETARGRSRLLLDGVTDSPNATNPGLDQWFRHELRDTVRAVLLDPRALDRPHLRRQAVEPLLDLHCSGKRDLSAAVSTLLGVEMAFRLLTEAT